MRRTIFVLIGLFFVLAPAARGQGGFTTVTGTITGAADGVVWSCGSISAQLITAGGAGATLNGGGFTTQTSPVGLGCPTSPGSGANGSFAMRLADSGVINPSNTTWKFTVNMTPGIAPPAGTGPQSFTFTTAINCSTNTPSTCTSNQMDISAQLSALAPRLSNSSGGGSSFPVTTNVTVNNGGSISVLPGSTGIIAATSDKQITGPLVIYPAAPPYNISFDGQVCYYVTWPNTSTLVTCTSGSAPVTGAVAANVETISFNLAQQPFNPLANGWKAGDSVTVSIFSGADTFLNGTFTLSTVTANTVTFPNVHANGSSTSNGLIVDSNVGPFVPADTGKIGFGTNCSTPLTCFPSPGGLATRPLGTVTYASPTTVNVSGNSTAAVLTPTGGQFWWFTDDRAKWCCGVGSVDYNIGLAGSCVSVSVPAGTTPLPFGFGNNNSPNCGTVSNGASGVGNTSRQAVGGNNIWGKGIANTTFLLPPDSNYAACTGISTSVAGNVGCLFSNFMGGGNFTITGGGHCQTGSNAVVLFNPSASSTFWQNVTMTDYGCFDAASIGVNYPFANKFDGMYNSGFGGQACDANGVNVILTNSYCGETRLSPLKINGSGTVLRTENFYIGATASTIGVWVGSDASALTWTSLHDQSYGAVGAGGTHIFINGPATAYMTSWYNASGSAYGVQLTATAKLFLRDSSPINGSTHAIGTNGVTLTTGGVFNLGGNQFTGAALESTVLPSCVLTTGGGSPGQSCATANTEGNNAFDVVMTMGTTPGSTGTTTITYAGTNQINSGILPNLTCDLADGTGAWGSTANVKVSTRSATAPVVTWTNSVLGVATALTAGNTYIISCQSEPN